MTVHTSSLVVLLTVAVAVVACGASGGGLEVTDSRIGVPTGPNAALYFTIDTDSGYAGAMEGASTDVAGAVEIHETSMNDDGTMGMQPLDAPLEVAAGGSLVLEPGGLHLMLIDVDPLEVGDTVTVTLNWRVAGAMDIEAEVVEPDETMDDEDHDG